VGKPINFMQGFVPADDLLLFRQKEEKPFLPVRGPSNLTRKQALRGSWSTAPNQDGEETRRKMQGHLSAQTALARGRIRGGGPAAPRAGEEVETETNLIWNDPSQLRIFNSVGITAFGCGGDEAPNRLFGESCLSAASSLAILIRGVGGGTWKRMVSFSTILWKAADGRKWFWSLLPKQK